MPRILKREILARVDDNAALEKLIYTVFYGGEIAFARRRLARALQRYLRGEPLLTAEEEQQEYLATLSHEERAEYWRERNRRTELAS